MRAAEAVESAWLAEQLPPARVSPLSVVLLVCCVSGVMDSTLPRPGKPLYSHLNVCFHPGIKYEKWHCKDLPLSHLTTVPKRCARQPGTHPTRGHMDCRGLAWKLNSQVVHCKQMLGWLCMVFRSQVRDRERETVFPLSAKNDLILCQACEGCGPV